MSRNTKTSNFQPHIKYRRATLDDNFYQIARLIYETDPKVYPYWGGNAHDFVQKIVPWMTTKGFIFYYRNIYIAHEAGDNFPLAILVALDQEAIINFDYDLLSVDPDNTTLIKDVAFLPQTRRVVQSYIEPLKAEWRWEQYWELNPAVLITNLCVDPALRSRGLGIGLLESYIEHMRRRNYRRFRLDCSEENYIARSMYEKYGFELLLHDTGFSAPGKAASHIVRLLYNTTPAPISDQVR